jgi:membrane associated rhomboid family serine protease
MAKHFSFSRYNLDGGRLHTMLTYGFSNMYFFSFLFDTLTIYLFGRSIEMRHGGNRLLKLFIMGTLLGGMTMAMFDRRSPFMVPHVGATAAVTSMLTFEACMNMGQRIMFFVFPMKIEFLVGFLVLQALFLDPLHRNLGGIAAGGLAYLLLKRGMF